MQPDVEALTDTDAANVPIQAYQPSLDALRTALAREIDDRRRAECALRIQSDAVQLALQLLVREPDVTGFFRAFIKALVDQSESFGAACGCSTRIRHAATCGWRTSAAASTPKTATDWDTLTLPRSSLATHLRRLPARVDSDDRIHGRRPAPACAGARFQPGSPVSRRWSPRRSCCQLAISAGWRSRPGPPPTARARGVERCSKPWRGRRRWRCTTTAWPNRATSRSGGRRCSKSATGSRATSTTPWRRDSAPS